jgi:hypothetical protein
MNVFLLRKMSDDDILALGTAFEAGRTKCEQKKQLKERPANIAADFQCFTGPNGIFADTTLILSNLTSPTFLASSSLLISRPVSEDAAARGAGEMPKLPRFRNVLHVVALAQALRFSG